LRPIPLDPQAFGTEHLDNLMTIAGPGETGLTSLAQALGILLVIEHVVLCEFIRDRVAPAALAAIPILLGEVAALSQGLKAAIE
jgi:hypothetical protein